MLHVPPGLTFTDSTFGPHSVFMGLYGCQSKGRLFPHRAMTLLDCITETERVYCAVWTEIFKYNSYYFSSLMAVSRLPVIAEAPVRNWAIIIFKNSVTYSAVTNTVLVVKLNVLMLSREIITVCSEIHTKHGNTLCGQNTELLNVKPGGI
jgi:hypothetical protein